jgi:two-component system response regulator VicR
VAIRFAASLTYDTSCRVKDGLMKILLVDDDRELVELLSFALLRAGLVPLPAYSTAQALGLLENERPALAILDVRLGDEDGLELLKEIRHKSDVLVIMLSALRAEEDKVRAFELGADDYVSKPFGLGELLARIKACLRRRQAPPDLMALKPLQVGALELNPIDYSVTKSGRAISLTPTEFRLLHYLMCHAGRVVTSRALMQQIWRDDEPSNTDPLRVAVHRLRRKLGDTPNAAGILHSVAGIGFVLKVTTEQAATG